jgi:hypothetical protein
MFKHIVMWRLKDQAEGAGKEENALKIKNMLEGLKSRIDEIQHVEVGIDVSRSEASYDVVLYSEFRNRLDCEAYARHPEHVKAAEFIGKVRTDRVVVDYEV